MIKVLVVDDEFPIANLIKETLEKSGYTCTCVYDGESAADAIENEVFDLVLLDVMLPKINGFELIEYIRQYNVPVIFLTAKTDVRDRVKGLRLGAEDYIIKPFDTTELVARVEVVLRRFEKYVEKIQILDLEIDPVSRQVTKAGVPVELTYKEFELLKLFLSHPGVAWTREKLMEQVWGTDYCGETRTVDMHIRTLRQKLGSYGEQIETVRNVGYRLEAEK